MSLQANKKNFLVEDTFWFPVQNFDPLNIKKVLVIQTAFLGDAVLITSMLEKLHHHAPLEIDLIVREECLSLFDMHPFLKNIWGFDKTHKFRSLRHLLGKTRKVKYDVVINAQRFFSSGLLAVLSGGKYTIGFNKNPLSFFYSKSVKHLIGDGVHLHEIGRNNQLINNIVAGPAPKPKLYTHSVELAFTPENKYLCIAPQSLWYTKTFPHKNWLKFIDSLPNDLQVILIGSQKDYSINHKLIMETTHPNCINLSGKLSLLQSAKLMKTALMNYTNDSAPLHLCSAVDAPITAIFCSTIPEFGFFPLSSRSTIVQTPQKLNCRPCGLHGFKACPKGHFKCSEIETEELLNPLKE